MKVNHKSLKLGVVFALVSTVGITSAEIIKHELSKPIIAVEETTTTTTTESPEKIKYKKEVQEFSKTMRPVVAKYGVTDEKLDELANKWADKQWYSYGFYEEQKKSFIEFIIDSITYNYIVKSVDKAIDIVQNANYLDTAHKEKWIAEMKENKEDQTENYPYHSGPYSRNRYYQEDRKNLLTNYPTILENTIQYVKEHLINYNTAKLYNHELDHIFGYAEMKEEQEINQDSSLSDQQKKQLLEKIDNILEDKYVLGGDRVPFETINDIILEIRQVHRNTNGNEYEEPFSKEKVEKYIDRIVKEKTESKVKEFSLNIKTQFEEYGNSQKTKVLEEGISEEAFSIILKSSSEKASKSARYYYRMHKEAELKYILRDAKNEFQDRIQSLKARNKVKEALTSYVNSKKQELEKYGISNEKINEIITRSVDSFSFGIRRGQEFEEAVENLTNDSKKYFDNQIKPYEIKYLSKERLKEYALEKQQELLKYGISNEKNRDIAEKVFDELRERRLDYNINREDNDAYLESLTNRAKNQYQEMVLEEIIKIKISKFRDEQEKLILANNRYTEIEKEKVVSEIRMQFGEPVIHLLRNKLNNNAKEFDTLSLSQKIEKMLSVVNDNIQNTHFTAPMNKNKYTVNNVALNEKLEINQDSSLSLSEKLALQLKVDELAEKVIKKIETLNLIGVNREGIPRSMTTEELSVFIEQIQNIHNAKVVNNANEGFKPKEEKIEKPLLEKPAPTQPIDNGATITEKPSVLPELKPVQPTETTSTIELKPVASKEKEEKATEVVLNKVETTKENEETTKEVVIRNKWEKKGNHWYYVDNDGKAVSKQWLGSYYIKADKTMAENEWIYDAKYNSWFYLDENGHYVENAWKDQYYLKSGGYMAKNEWIFDSSYNSWYYLNEDGSYARNQWIQSNGKWYYVLSNGKMAKNTVIDGYQLNGNGEWI